MRRIKEMSLIVATALLVTIAPQNVLAGVVAQDGIRVERNNYVEQVEKIEERFDILTDNKLSIRTNKVDKSLNEKDSPDELLEKIDARVAEDSIEEEMEEETPTPNLYYGTVTGNLTGSNDYDLYTVPLTQGQYLQLRLTVPISSVDYDLLLLDSSLNTIKTSDYYAYNNGSAGVLAEDVGYIAPSNQTVYACVYSVNGGSTTDAYTLDFTIGENTYDLHEPNENAKESGLLTFTSLEAGANVSRTLCSPLDNDWYTFSIPDSLEYDQVRFSISSSSSTNGCRFEVYQNLGVGGYAMSLVTSGTGGEGELPAGTYYLRVVSTNSLTNYDVSDIPTYTLKILPISKVDEIKYIEYTNTQQVTYNEGTKPRVDGTSTPGVPKRIGVRGRAVYRDADNIERPAVNARITCKVENESWTTQNRPDLAITQNSAITNSSGVFSMDVYFNDGLGLNSYVNGNLSIHKYDIMKLSVIYKGYPIRDDVNDKFYYLVNTM